jgi:hypothetical protein
VPVEPVDLGAGLLWWEDDSPHGPRAHATFADSGTGVRLERDGDRVRCSLTFRSGAMAVDVSIQPGAVVRTSDGLARERCIDPHRWSSVLAGRAALWAGLDPASSRGPAQQTALLRTMTVITHPLLGQIVAAGAEPLAEIPRWASPVLRAADASGAARALVGADATRRVARSLMASLRPSCTGAGTGTGTGTTIDLGPLSLAVIAAGLVTADELATVIDERGPTRLLAELPSVDDVEVCRRGLAVLPPQRRAAVLRDAARAADPACLTEVMHHLWWARDRVEHPLPGRIADLRRVCAHQVAVLPSPSARPVETAPAVAPRQPPRIPRPIAHQTAAATRVADEQAIVTPPPRRTPARPVEPTPVCAAPTPNGHHPSHWTTPQPLRLIDGLTTSGLRLVVPRSTNELRRWGDLLHNCLADYAGASARGESWLVAIERDDTVIGCIEVTPTTRRIRQALGPRNRPLPRDVLTVAVRALERHGIVTTPAPTGRTPAQTASR